MKELSEAELYDMFFDYMDKLTGDITVPGIGDVPTKIYKATDVLTYARLETDDGEHLLDALFDEWIKITYGEKFFLDFIKKHNYT